MRILVRAVPNFVSFRNYLPNKHHREKRMQRAKHISIRVHAFPGEHVLLRVLLFALFACMLGYAYFVIVSITNVIAHKEAMTESDRLRSAVGLLEQEYFELAKTITPEAAGNLGMIPTSEISYIRRPGAVGVAEGSKGL